MARLLYVRNFHKYQHYKGETRQRPPWVKLHRQILEDEALMALPPEQRWVALGLLILASESPPPPPEWGGSRRVVAGEREVSRRLGTHPSTTRVAIKNLLRIGFLASSPIAGRKQKGSLDTEEETETNHRNGPLSKDEARDVTKPRPIEQEIPF